MKNRLFHLRQSPINDQNPAPSPSLLEFLGAPAGSREKKLLHVNLNDTHCLGGLFCSCRGCSSLCSSGGKHPVVQPAIDRGEWHALRYWWRHGLNQQARLNISRVLMPLFSFLQHKEVIHSVEQDISSLGNHAQVAATRPTRLPGATGAGADPSAVVARAVRKPAAPLGWVQNKSPHSPERRLLGVASRYILVGHLFLPHPLTRYVPSRQPPSHLTCPL